MRTLIVMQHFFNETTEAAVNRSRQGHHPTNADPLMLGFEGYKLRDAGSRYDYYGYVEDDIVVIDPHVTANYQNLTEAPRLELPFLDDTIAFERRSYPSADCFFLNGAQLSMLAASPHFLDGDVSYLSPPDPAVTLSVMKTFRIYKPVLNQAWFLQVLHASPRWIGSVTQIATLAAGSPSP